MNEREESRTDRRRRVLVAVMNSQRDFEIARDQGWYRIPYDRSPSRVGADYLAFYQTKVFEEERWAVNYYASVRRYGVVRRRSLLPQEPDHPGADSLYYKIEIGPLVRLTRSVPSFRLRRITFIPTTLGRLLEADEINDLWCGSVEEERLWRAFKEEGVIAERCYPLREGEEVHAVDFALFCRDGKLAICIDGTETVENVSLVRERPRMDDYDVAAHGWRVVRLTAQDITGSLSGCLATVTHAARALGEVLPLPAL